MFRRGLPWLVALLCVLVGGVLWLYRTRQVDADGGLPTMTGAEIVRKAWTEGRRVALKGHQTSLMPGPKGEPIRVEANVLVSDEGCLRIEYLSAPLKGATVWECDERTYRYNPRLERISVASRRSTDEEAREQQMRLLTNYEATKAGEERVAGRPAVVVELRPHSESSRWKRVWVDPKTWVILASEDYGAADQVLRSTRFTRVEYLSPSQLPAESEFRPSDAMLRKYASAQAGDTSARFTPEQLSRIVGFEIRQPTWLPAGYTLEGAYQIPCACGRRHQAARLEYTDGLNHITLFQCGRPECEAADDCFGAGNNDPQVAALSRGGYRYLAVGDASPETLSKMLRSALPNAPR
ncbi:MAG: sigma-E factor regulatory protein RseB domain-containing protein [Armatimonadota bacterium]